MWFAKQAWGGVVLGGPTAVHVIRNFPDAAGLRAAVVQLGDGASDGIAASFILFFALVAVRFLVRRNGIAYVLILPLLVFGNQFANPTGLLAFIDKSKGAAKVQPDQKILFKGDWEKDAVRLKAVRKIASDLAALAVAPPQPLPPAKVPPPPKRRW